MRSEVKKVPARQTLAKKPWGADFVSLAHANQEFILQEILLISMGWVWWAQPDLQENVLWVLLFWVPWLLTAFLNDAGTFCRYAPGDWRSPEILSVTVSYLCLCRRVTSLHMHSRSFSFLCKGQGALVGFHTPLRAMNFGFVQILFTTSLQRK